MDSKFLLLAICLAIAANTAKAQDTAPANGWHTWTVADVATLRLPPPPDTTADELQQVKTLVASADLNARRAVTFWNAGAPAYRWIQIAQQEVARHNLGGPAATRAMALVAVGLSDSMAAAWDSKYKYCRRRPSQVDPAISTLVDVPNTPSYPSEHAVAAVAASTILAYLFPDRASALTASANEALQADLFTGAVFPSDSAAGMTLGTNVAAGVIGVAQKDGSDAVFSGSFPDQPGKFSSPNPVLPLAGTWKPWALSSGSAVRLQPPPAAPATPQFLAQVEAVQHLRRTAATNHTAWFWQPSFIDPWINTINRLLFERKLDRDAMTSAAIYALGMVAQHDASIACWDTKYTYLEQRPAQADPEIEPLFATPQHPSFPSGHACAGAAIAGVLSAIFPDSAAAFAAEGTEAGMSTFYAGIHYPQDVDQGLALGRNVAAVVISTAGIKAQPNSQSTKTNFIQEAR